MEHRLCSAANRVSFPAGLHDCQMSRDASLDLLKKDARKLEGELESRIHQFTRLTASIGSRFDGSASYGGGGGGAGGLRDIEDPEVVSSADDLRADIETLLQRFGDINTRMGRCIASARLGLAAQATHRRYREILFDYNTEFNRLKRGFRKKRESAELFRGMRSGGIGAGASGGGGPGAHATAQLMRERDGLLSSAKLADGVLGQAGEMQRALGRQRRTLLGAGRKVLDIGMMIPGVDVLIGKIRRKKLRDQIVLGIVVGLCFVFILWWLVS